MNCKKSLYIRKVADKEKNRQIVVNFDGLCEPVNPAGIACYGFVVKENDDRVLYRGYGLVVGVEPFSNAVNNNIAEYGGAIKAMEWLIENGYAAAPTTNDGIQYKILVRGDSQLIIRKLKSTNYSNRAARSTSFYDRAVALRSKFADIKFEWVKRTYNREADELAKRAYYEALRRYPVLQRKVREHWGVMLWLEERMYCSSDEEDDNGSSLEHPVVANAISISEQRQQQ